MTHRNHEQIEFLHSKNIDPAYIMEGTVNSQGYESFTLDEDGKAIADPDGRVTVFVPWVDPDIYSGYRKAVALDAQRAFAEANGGYQDEIERLSDD